MVPRLMDMQKDAHDRFNKRCHFKLSSSHREEYYEYIMIFGDDEGII